MHHTRQVAVAVEYCYKFTFFFFFLSLPLSSESIFNEQDEGPQSKTNLQAPAILALASTCILLTALWICCRRAAFVAWRTPSAPFHLLTNMWKRACLYDSDISIFYWYGNKTWLLQKCLKLLLLLLKLARIPETGQLCQWGLLQKFMYHVKVWKMQPYKILDLQK